jgi:sugar (pentulose or hexulose) kinase
MNPLVKSTTVGTVLQVLMVVLGHFSPQIAQMFPIGGTGISAVAGLLFSLWSKGTTAGGAAGGGAVAGGLSAILGILVSMGLGDVPASTLGVGTVSSGVAGVIGGLLGRAFAKK